MKPCIICGDDISHRHTNAKTCEGSCALEHRREQRRKHSKRHYENNREVILEGRKEYQVQWRTKNPDYQRQWREKNPEYHPTINRSWHHKLTSDLVPRVQSIVSRCNHDRAERICWGILNSTQPRWERFKRSFAGDDILGSYIE